MRTAMNSMKYIFFLLVLCASVYAADTSVQIPYSGYIENSGSPVTGSVNMKFVLHDGSATLWSNDGSVGGAPAEPTAALSATASAGHVTAYLGESADTNMTVIPTTVFSDNSDVYLRVWVDGTQLTPDKSMTAVPYAFYSLSDSWVSSNGNLTHSGNIIIETDLSLKGELTYDGSTKPKRTIILTAEGAIPKSSGGALQTTTDVSSGAVTHYVLSYDSGTAEYASWSWIMPDSYDGGNINISLFWYASPTTGDVVWSAQTVGIADTESVDSPLGPAQTVTDSADGTTLGLVVSSITAYDPGWDGGDVVLFRMGRDATNGSDTLSDDAHLLRVKIEYSVSTESD